jgi:hypothetical protein
VQVENCPTGGGFAAAALAHDAKRFPAPDFERHIIHGFNSPHLTTPNNPSHDREMLFQVLDTHQNRFVIRIIHNSCHAVISDQ